MRIPQATLHVVIAGGIDVEENGVLARGAEPVGMESCQTGIVRARDQGNGGH